MIKLSKVVTNPAGLQNGTTWFVFHYAWAALQRYRDAQKRGIEYPRLPLVIILRDNVTLFENKSDI